jgi:hypothetical protein
MVYGKCYPCIFSLTAHGIDSEWKRHKFVLCVRHFPGSHNFESISAIMDKMLNEWGISEAKRHVFLRDEGTNMKKVRLKLCITSFEFSLCVFRALKKADISMLIVVLTS